MGNATCTYKMPALSSDQRHRKRRCQAPTRLRHRGCRSPLLRVLRQELVQVQNAPTEVSRKQGSRSFFETVQNIHTNTKTERDMQPSFLLRSCPSSCTALTAIPPQALLTKHSRSRHVPPSMTRTLQNLKNDQRFASLGSDQRFPCRALISFVS